MSEVAHLHLGLADTLPPLVEPGPQELPDALGHLPGGALVAGTLRAGGAR